MEKRSAERILEEVDRVVDEKIHLAFIDCGDSLVTSTKGSGAEVCRLVLECMQDQPALADVLIRAALLFQATKGLN